MMNISPESTNYITRSEYEARHSELRTELIRLSSEGDTHFRWVVEENEKMRKDVQAKFDALSAKLDAAQETIDSARINGWKLVAVSLINLLVGGGLVGALNYLHLLH